MQRRALPTLAPQDGCFQRQAQPHLLHVAASSTSPGGGCWHAPCSRSSSSIAASCGSEAGGNKQQLAGVGGEG